MPYKTISFTDEQVLMRDGVLASRMDLKIARELHEVSTCYELEFNLKQENIRLEIYVDADACPVKQEVMRVADRHGLAVQMVSNRWLPSADAPNVHRVVVSDAPDAADVWIAEHIGADDIAVTSDIPLAARCLEAGAAALGPTGKPFTEDSIGMALAMRGLMADLRDGGEIKGHNPGFSKRDRSNFLRALEDAIRAKKRQSLV